MFPPNFGPIYPKFVEEFHSKKTNVNSKMALDEKPEHHQHQKLYMNVCSVPIISKLFI